MKNKLSGAWGMLSEELDNPEPPKQDTPEKPPEKKPEAREVESNKPVSKPPAKKPRAKKTAAPEDQLVSLDPNRVRTWRYKDRQPEDLVGPEYDDLLQSIARKGQDTPILVRPIKHKDYDYEEVTGFRRLHICRALGINVLAVVRDMSDRQAFSAQIDENDKRSGMSYWRRAQSLKKVVEDQVYPSLDAMAVEIGIARSTISNYIRVVDGMPDVFVNEIPLQNCPREVLFYLMAQKVQGETFLNRWIKARRSDFIYSDPIRLKDVEKSFNDYLNLIPQEDKTEKPKKKDGAKTYVGKAGKLFSITRKGDQVSVNILKDGKRIMDDEELADALLKIMDEKAES